MEYIMMVLFVKGRDNVEIYNRNRSDCIKRADNG